MATIILLHIKKVEGIILFLTSRPKTIFTFSKYNQLSKEGSRLCYLVFMPLYIFFNLTFAEDEQVSTMRPTKCC